MASERKWRVIPYLHGLTVGTAIGLLLQHAFVTRGGDTLIGLTLGWILLIAAGIFTVSKAYGDKKASTPYVSGSSQS